jgi:RNA-directed DNA polymerase
VLKSTALLLEAVFPQSRGKVPQAKVAELQRVLKTDHFDGFIRLDIENFYPSISHKAVMDVVRKRIRKPEILSLILDAIRTPTLGDRAPRSDVHAAQGVPQGLPISNLLAEIAMQKVDRSFGSVTGTFYLRYVDDIIILCNHNDAEKICDEVMAACRSISLTVHDPKLPGSKSRLGLISESIDYLGYVFSPTKVSVRPESISNLKASIARVFTRYKYEVAAGGRDAAAETQARTECLWKLNLVITGCVFDGQRRGWIHYFSQIDDLSSLKGLDATVRNFARRFGLGDDFQPKSFTRAFWRINKSDASGEPYIPDFDTFSPVQKRQLLVEVFHVNDAERFSDEVAERVFYKEVKRLVDKLEQDVSGLS